MKNLKFVKLIPTTLLYSALTLLSFSCNDKDVNVIDDDSNIVSTAEEFNTLRENALENITQNFQLDTSNGYIQFTSEKDVQFSLNSDCLTLNGVAVEGIVDIEFIEIFDGGTMLVTDKTTMGKLPDGNMAMLVSGGEFYINATQNGEQLELDCNMNLVIPASLTTEDPDMILWDGVIDEDGNIDWEEKVEEDDDIFIEVNDILNAPGYYTYFESFGWTNVDKFYNYAGLKTEILVEVPSDYNKTNSAVYLHYDGEGNALAKLDTYDASTKQFSEHYGQIPIGLDCHIIFTTQENGQWRYAIQGVTITDNAVYYFDIEDTTLDTEDALIAAINALP